MCLCIILAFGAISAGRISIFGLILGVVVILIKMIIFIKNKKGIIKSKILVAVSINFNYASYNNILGNRIYCYYW